MMQFNTPIPIVVKETKEDGYALYVESGGMLENDIWTCVLCNGGIIRHYNTSQLVIYNNATFNIDKNGEPK
ncbi:MAG: hypothetical protein RLZ10_3090 [Bacteroidota bacterium]|jgi:hypothetical protein